MSINEACEKKKKIISEITRFAESLSFKEGCMKMNELDEEFRGAGYAGDQNKDLFNEFIAAKKDFYSRLSDHKENVKNSKMDIVNEIRGLQYSENSKERLAALQEKYKTLGYAGKGINDELYSSLKEATNGYYERVRVIYEERASQKEELINRVMFISGEDGMYKFGKELYEINNQWKLIGFSGSNNKELNDRYYRYLDAIKIKRTEEKEAKLQEEERVADRKQEIINKVIEFMNVENPNTYISDVRELTTEFYSIGYAPKGKNQALSDEFARVKGLFYETVTSYNNERYRNRAERYQNQIENKEAYVRRLEENISDLYCKIDFLDYDSRYYETNKSRYESYIENNEEKLREVREQIYELTEKRIEVLNKIK